MATLVESFPAGRTWVFQGTVAEDGTGGTHVCTLTVVPGAGNEMQVLYGKVKVGNTATSQTVLMQVTDGTNVLVGLGGFPESGLATTTANQSYALTATSPIATASQGTGTGAGAQVIISGTMQLLLTVSTAAISVTQTFAVVCRIRGTPPTATLADSVGTPVLTVNTNAVFG